MFKFEIDEEVTVKISGEKGFVKGVAAFKDSENQVFLHYKGADGRATDAWFFESEVE